ncbi:MAG: TRAP transporter TatT component family protein [Gammaproteobacteria bacterium]|nr:TRAP transporter TatT component family protein [Gammaproteobacteria bacterium]
MARLLIVVLLFALIPLSGCTSMISASASRGMADNLNSAILNQNDPETVRQGAPAYLIMIDSFIEGSPKDPKILMAGSRLYGAYTSAFIDDPERAKRLSAKSLKYAEAALCISMPSLCNSREMRFPEYQNALKGSTFLQVPALYDWGVAWAGWLQANSDDWDAIGDVPKIKATMEKVVDLNPGYDNGGAYLYLGVLNSLIPPSMGGKPDEARAYFERAIEMSEGHNLMAKTVYAQYYARMMFDQELHDRLLNEVLEAEPEYPGLTLINVLAQEQAEQLLAESKEIF